MFGSINLYRKLLNWINAEVVQNVLFNDEEQVGLSQGTVTENFNKTSVCNNCFSFGNNETSENPKVVKFMKLHSHRILPCDESWQGWIVVEWWEGLT